MAKSKRKKGNSRTKNYVVVNNSSYGNDLKGTKIYFEGRKPKSLSKDGKIGFGKNILELLQRKFDRFRWILTKSTDSITLERKIYRVRTSLQTMKSMYGDQFARNRDIKTDIIKNRFSVLYPEHFKQDSAPVYVPGTLARTLPKATTARLSSEDRDALNRFLPGFISSESLNTVNLLKAVTQTKTLKELAADLDASISDSHSESWWQTFIQKNILIIQQGYIKAIEKMNITIGNTKFPDFSLVTHDNYLDILEIKKPDTNLLKPDPGRGNHYWDPEIAKAFIQVENYIENISRHADSVRSYILDNYRIGLKVVRPRGIILAGDTRRFKTQKEKDDFRLLCQSVKNVTFVTYDELLERLKNYIRVLEEHSLMAKKQRPKVKTK